MESRGWRPADAHPAGLVPLAPPPCLASSPSPSSRACQLNTNHILCSVLLFVLRRFGVQKGIPLFVDFFTKRTISLHRQRKHDNSKSSLDCRECGDEISFIRHIKNKSKMKHRVICRYGHNYISPLGGCHPAMNFQRKSGSKTLVREKILPGEINM